MNELERFKRAPNSINEIKLQMFLPFSKCKKEVKENYTIFENDEYKIEIIGYRFTQIHRDILDIINYFGDNSFDKKSNDGRPVRFFTLYDIQKRLGYLYKKDGKWLASKISEIKNSVIKIYNKKNKTSDEFDILARFRYSEKQGKFGVIYSREFIDYFSTEISINYLDYLNDLLNLKNAQTRAAVRYILTYSNSFEINLDKLLIKIGIDEEKSIQNFRDHRNKILEEEEILKDKFGIELKKKTNNKKIKSDYKVCYKKLKNVGIYHPLKSIDDKKIAA